MPRLRLRQSSATLRRRGRRSSREITRSRKAKSAKVRQKDRDGRWAVKHSKAQVKDGAAPKAFKPAGLEIPMFGY